MKAAIITLVLNLALITNGQQSSCVTGLSQSAERRIQEVVKNLESDNPLRLSLEEGCRGDGIHHAWMNKMKQYGGRQVSFIISFNWETGIESLKIKDISFLRQYYRFDTEIKDRDLLRQINDAGLEQELRDAILGRAVTAVPSINNVARTVNISSRRAHGTLYLNLLDDEALPILDTMPDVVW